MPRIEHDNRVEYTNDAGELHRDGDLPAIEWNDGDKTWWIEGKCHRIDNPAVIGSDGYESWRMNNIYYTTFGYYRNLYPYKGILLDTSTECQRGRE